ncbi:MAG: hypothetical protein ACK4IX_07070 [Candidatus Sericytochromatia bacterium]
MSLEGLSSLIQLESARLEGARQVTQNSQSVNQSVQQIGLQTASSKQNMWLQKIEARMDKEMAEADVRRLESKLQRERKAEKLAALVAQVVTAGSLVSNMWDFGVNDLMKKDQKLGDTPDYLHSKPMDIGKPNDVNLNWKTAKSPGEGTSDQLGFVTQRGGNGDGTETVYAFTQKGSGQTVDMRAATVSPQDIKQITGRDFKDFKAVLEHDEKNGTKFAEMIMQDKSHAVSRAESENFMDSVKVGLSNQGFGFTVDGKDTKTNNVASQGNKDSTEMALVSQMINDIKKSSPTPTNDQILAKLKENANSSPNMDVKVKDIINSKSGFEAALVLAGTQAITNNAVTTGTQPPIPSLSPNEASDAIKNGSAKVETVSKMGFASQYNDRNKNSKLPKESVIEQVQVTHNGKSLTFELGSEWMKANGFEKQAGLSFSEIYKNSPAIASQIVSKMDTAKGAPVIDNGAFDSKGLDVAKTSLKTLNSLESGLKGAGKLPPTYNTSGFNKFLDGAGTVGKGLINVMVQTGKDAVPYFQAYLAAKDRADNTQDELTAARDKLAAKNKRLKSIEQQINDFAVKGA